MTLHLPYLARSVRRGRLTPRWAFAIGLAAWVLLLPLVQSVATADDDEQPDVPLAALQPVASGFDQPVGVVAVPDESGRLLVLEKTGAIHMVRAGTALPRPFLDLTDEVGSEGAEQGLLALAFHPRFAENREFYVHYTDSTGDSVIAGYQVSADPDIAIRGSARRVLSQEQPGGEHNGGTITFGPDGYLWIGFGDGGSNATSDRPRSQDGRTWSGKLLRIDVDNGIPYEIPADNPFIGRPAHLPEIWAKGLRNPWRFSFDRLTGDLWIADVGEVTFEEINYVPAGTGGGMNFGWPITEGDSCLPAVCSPDLYNQPVDGYDHGGDCSITGGYVYRGSAVPALYGRYLYGDFCSGHIWYTEPGPDGFTNDGVVSLLGMISAFGEDQQGEILVVDFAGGAIHRLGPVAL